MGKCLDNNYCINSLPNWELKFQRWILNTGISMFQKIRMLLEYYYYSFQPYKFLSTRHKNSYKKVKIYNEINVHTYWTCVLKS